MKIYFGRIDQQAVDMLGSFGLRVVMAAWLSLITVACAPIDMRLAPEPETASCRAPAQAQAVRWAEPLNGSNRERLNSWCAAVGSPVVVTARTTSRWGATGPLLIVSWNIHVGGGDVRLLVRTIGEAERSVGNPVPRLVLLLQETYRSGAAVPESYPRASAVPDRIAPPRRDSLDIVALARELDMNLLYVPSMRNGRETDLSRREDRGNAILSNVPLSDFVAIELPFEGQRRVAVAAMVRDGARPIMVMSVHLDFLTRWAHGHILGAVAARRRLAEALLGGIDRLAFEAPLVIGGDFNTQVGDREAAIQRLASRLPRVACGSRRTHVSGLQLDHIFVNPQLQPARCERMNQSFASDHFPLVLRLANQELENWQDAESSH